MRTKCADGYAEQQSESRKRSKPVCRLRYDLLRTYGGGERKRWVSLVGERKRGRERVEEREEEKGNGLRPERVCE
jgi:hypothetical protein